MASISATTVRFQPLSSIKNITQGNGGISSSIVRFGWTKSSTLPTLRTSRIQRVYAAKSETIEKVINIVRKQLALREGTEVTAETTFATLGADSLDTVEIVMALEEEFDINVEEENAQSITNIQEAAQVIDDLVTKKA